MAKVKDKDLIVRYTMGGRASLNHPEVEKFRPDTLMTEMIFNVLSKKEVKALKSKVVKMKEELKKKLIVKLEAEAAEKIKVFKEVEKNTPYMARGIKAIEKAGHKPVMNRFTIVKPDKTTGEFKLEG